MAIPIHISTNSVGRFPFLLFSTPSPAFIVCRFFDDGHSDCVSENESHSVVSDSLWPRGLYSPWNSPGQNPRAGSLSLLQGIFSSQGSNPGLPVYRQILSQLSHQGNSRILEGIAYPFSRVSSPPRNRTRVSCIVGGFFTNWTIREAQATSY